MAKQNVVLVPVSDLKIVFFVRKQLNQDRAVDFALRFEKLGLEALPPIIITSDHRVVDGRTRVEGASLAGLKHIRAILVPAHLTEMELLAMAFNANLSEAPLPPSPEDYNLTITRMLNNGMKRSEILAAINDDPKVVRKYIDYAQSHIRKNKLNNALRAVALGKMKTDEAALQFDVTKDDLEAAIFNSKQARKENTPLANIKSNIKEKYNSANLTCGQYFRQIFEQLHGGELKPDEYRDLIEFTRKLATDNLRRVDDWAERGEAEIKLYTKQTA